MPYLMPYAMWPHGFDQFMSCFYDFMDDLVARASMSSLEPIYKVVEFNPSITFARHKVEDVANDQVHLTL